MRANYKFEKNLEEFDNPFQISSRLPLNIFLLSFESLRNKNILLSKIRSAMVDDGLHL
jgi:hypothetical protein